MSVLMRTVGVAPRIAADRRLGAPPSDRDTVRARPNRPRVRIRCIAPHTTLQRHTPQRKVRIVECNEWISFSQAKAWQQSRRSKNEAALKGRADQTSAKRNARKRFNEKVVRRKVLSIVCG